MTDIMELSNGQGQVQQAFQRIVADGSSRVHMGNVFNYAVSALGKYEECLRLLFSTNPRDDLAAIRRSKGSRVKGTCEWILTHHTYAEWINARTWRLLRLAGSPGIGKSMLASFLVDELEKSAIHKPGLTLMYYFCDNKDEKRNNALSVVRTLLWQLLRLEPALFKNMQSDYEQTTDLPASFDGLWRILLNAIDEASFDELYILIDALDECDSSSRQILMDNMKEATHRWEANGVLVKVLLTSRPEVDIEETFDGVHGCDSLRVDSGKINGDLKAFISSKVADVVQRKHWPAKWIDRIGTALNAQSGGTFLWASLVLDDISRAKTTKVIEEKLANLPSDLTQVYDRILQNIGEEYIQTAIYILRWVVVAQRPLSVSELAMVQAMNPVDYEGRNIPSLDSVEDCEDGYKSCIPLLERDPNTDTINLIHQSAKDYLLSSAVSKKLSHYHVDLNRAQVMASEICCRFLCCEEFDNVATEMDSKLDRRNDPGWWIGYDWKGSDWLNQIVFLKYAAAFWDEHCSLIPDDLLESFACFKGLSTQRPEICRSWLKLAVTSGQHMTVQKIIARFPGSINLKDTDETTALFHVKDDAVVQLLLDNGADIKLMSKAGNTALHSAVSGGHEEAIKALLHHGAYVDSKNRAGGTPLYYAKTKDIVRLLIDKGANVQTRSANEETALHRIRNAEVVQELLDRGSEIDAKDVRGWTAFHKAVCDKDEAVVDVLLTNGADINARGKNGQTALARASRYGYTAMVQKLLDMGADVNIVDHMGHTCLDMAEELKAYRERSAAESWVVASQSIIELLQLKGAKRGLELLRGSTSDVKNGENPSREPLVDEVGRSEQS